MCKKARLLAGVVFFMLNHKINNVSWFPKQDGWCVGSEDLSTLSINISNRIWRLWIAQASLLDFTETTVCAIAYIDEAKSVDKGAKSINIARTSLYLLLGFYSIDFTTHKQIKLHRANIRQKVEK